MSELLDNSTGSPGIMVRDQVENYGSVDNSLARVASNKLENPLSPAKRNIILLSIYTSVFLGALDTTIVATLLTVIANELDSLPQMSWIATSYLLSCAAFQPLFGKLSDIFGRRSCLLFSHACFISGCLMCGLASSFNTLVIGRFLTGIGGGGFNTLGTITMSDVVSLRHRGMYQGFGNISFGLGAASGGIVAGIFQSTFGWRLAFLLQIPICLIAASCIVLFLHLPEGLPGLGVQGNDIGKKLKKVDVIGSLILVASLVFFMTAASIGGELIAYASPQFAFLAVGSVVGLVSFYYYEMNVPAEPVIPVYLLKQPTVIFLSLNCWFMSMTMFSYLYFTPFFWLSVKNMTPTDSGLRLISNFLGVSTGSVFAGLYMKRTGRYYSMNIVAGAVAIIGSVQIILLSKNSHAAYEKIVLFLPGFGCAIMLTVSLVAMISSVTAKEQALTTSIQYGFRSTGCTLGVSLASAIFRNSLVGNLKLNFLRLDNLPAKYSDAVIRQIFNAALKNSNYAHSDAPEIFKQAIIGAYDTACHSALQFALFTCVLGVTCNFLIHEHPLVKK